MLDIADAGHGHPATERRVALPLETGAVMTAGQHIDLTNCDREPIHVLGTIQPFGFLITVSSDWLVSRVSANIEAFLGIPPEAALGGAIDKLLSASAVHTLRNATMRLQSPDAVERLFNLQLRTDGPAFDIAIHFSERSVVIEAEPVAVDEFDAATLVRSMVTRLDLIADPTAFLREGARQIKALTGFDRVMVYRFDAAANGEVVAEAVRPGVDSFLGLHYPASDIPSQARSLYLRSLFRIIADVNAAPVPIIPTIDLRGAPLDQSLSVLRAVSPIHIEYLGNMGVEASLSISIVVEGRLWGLFACHHHAPLLPSFAQRSAAELFGRMFAMMLEIRERHLAAQYETNGRMIADRLMAAIAEDSALLANASWLEDMICKAVPADGVGISIDGAVVLSGLTPDRDQFGRLTRMLNQLTGSEVFATDCIMAQFPEAGAYSTTVAGMLTIPLSRSPRDYVVLFRSERLRAVRWAGNPEKRIEYGPNGARLTPRKSFEEWSELVKGTSLPFTAPELRLAESLRVALLEVVVRMSDGAARDSKRAQQKQELLIAELNHRVRNILALIRGLISQSRDQSLSADAFVATLGDRVQALARAHDQLTADRWGQARLIDLIMTESGAYLGDRRKRVLIDGPNVLIDPTAFTALALVVHELITNAAKYGALSGNGLVTIGWTVDPDAGLAIQWREIDGPPVRPPTRSGFGSTIIRQSIPYDLGGEARVTYATTGFEADFLIPSRFVGDLLPDLPLAEVTPESIAPMPVEPLAGCRVLLVEDSMIVALDGEDALRELGASEVQVASTVDGAMTVVRQGTLDFAILDFNLGDETSLDVAQALLDRHVPFLFATGYGESLGLSPTFDAIGIITKPYNLRSLAVPIAAARLAETTKYPMAHADADPTAVPSPVHPCR